MKHYTITALILLSCCTSLFGQKKVKELLKLGYEQYHNGDFDAAWETSKAILFEDPDRYEGYGFKGVLEMIFGEREKAISDLNYAIEKGVKHPDVYASRAKWFVLNNKLPEAEEDYTKAIDLDSKSPGLFVARGMVRINLLKFDLAVADFDKRVALAPNDPKSYYYRGYAYSYAENWDQSIQDEERALQLNLERPALSEIVLAKCAQHQNRLHDAENYLNKALEHDPKLLLAWNQLGELKMEMRDYQAAIKAFQATIAIDSRDQIAHGQLGMCYYALGNSDTAIALLMEAIDFPGPVTQYFQEKKANLYLEIGKLDEAIVDYSNLIFRAGAGTKAEWYFARGKAFMRKGKTESGARDFEAAINTATKNYDMQLDIALEYYSAGNLRTAQSLIEKVKVSGKSRPKMYLTMGQISFQENRFETAISNFTTSLSFKSPDSAYCYCYRAHSKFNLGRLYDAGKDLDTLLSLKTITPHRLSDLGYLLGEMQRYAEALEVFARSLAIDPIYPNTYNNRGCVREKMGDYEGAILDYSKSIELGIIDQHIPTNNRANALKALKRYDEALEDFNLAIAYKADYAAAYNDRGETYELMGDRKRAIQDFEKALELEPENEAAKANVERMKN